MTGKVVTIDGPAGSGKSTIAGALAVATNIPFLSTGLLYRAVGFSAMEQGLEPRSGAALQTFLDVLDIQLQPTSDRSGFDVVLDGELVPAATLKKEEVSHAASQFAALPEVREKLLDLQRQAGEQSGVIVEGRDTGSVIFPDADLKIFLFADPVERARRRALENGLNPEDPTVLEEIQKRDERDTQRTAAPLVVPEGAVEVDCTDLGIEETVAYLLPLLG